jgi:serine/threonine-protein kinase
MVGEYQVTGLLGTGGMGSVYSGIQPVIGKRVAIKVLLRELASNPQVVNRFIQEARAVNQVRSRYIVDIFSFGEIPDGRHYFVMEQLEGRSLRDLLRERKTLSFNEAFAVLSCVAKGLIAAHGKGIVHRDIKPENIMVRVEEDDAITAKILDFGIAKLQTGDSSNPTFSTRTGVAMGTPFYMSPEQCRGVGVDHRTDIYAIGIIMFEMFTGALPFTARSYIDLVNKHLFAEPPSPSRLSSMPRDLETLILRCIAKDPKDRPQSVEEFLGELLRIAPSMVGRAFRVTPYPQGLPGGSEEVVVVPPSALGVTEPPLPSRRRPLLLLLGLLVAGGSGVIGYTYFSRHRAVPATKMAGGPPPDAAASRLATLRVTTSPGGAKVLLDGQAQPRPTPLSLQLPPGKHALRVELAGYETQTKSVELRPTDTVLLEVELVASTARQSTAKLVITTGNPRTTYRLDDKEVGMGSMLALDNIPAGEHRLSVAAPGSPPVNRTITLIAGSSQTLEVPLQSMHHKGKKKSPEKGQTAEDSDATLDPFHRHR